jgi:integrase
LPAGASLFCKPARAASVSRKERVMASAWLYQDDKQVKKYGAEKASWYVGWIDPEGKRRCKSCGPGERGKRNAEKLRKKREAELITGTYQDNSSKVWEDFRKEYEERILGGLSVRTREEVVAALGHFERLLKPGKVFALTTAHIDRFVAARRQEPGKKKGSLVSPATVNKELRHLRAVLAVAHEWGCLPKPPKFRMEKEPKKLPTYVSAEHFAAIYRACDVARFPAGQPFPAADWWRALLVAAYMTGWRISELLALRREDLDLQEGVAVTRAEDNKGKRDEAVKLHAVVVEHLKALPGFSPFVLPWPHNKTTLYKQFALIQEAAKVQNEKGEEVVGIRLPCPRQHEHTRYCHVYGFHDLRRAFATMNADKLTPDALQALMRHRSYSTTQRYIAIARQMDAAVASLHVPEVLKKEARA